MSGESISAMSTAEKFREYAADCVQKAAGTQNPEEKNLHLNMALAWVRLAQQKQSIVPAAAAKTKPESERPLPGEAAKADGTPPSRPH